MIVTATDLRTGSWLSSRIRRRYHTAIACVAVLAFGGCSTSNDVPMGGAAAEGPPAQPRFSEPASTGQGPPDVNSVPTQTPVPSPQAERDLALQGLIADRANARHTNQGARTMPVAVRPLQPRADDETLSEPSAPDAVPVDPVARLDDEPPPRPAEVGGSGPRAQAPRSPSAPAAGPNPSRAPVPGRSIAGNESAESQTAMTPLGEYQPLSAFDSGAFTISNQVASLTFVERGISPEDRRALAEAAEFRRDVQGVLRI
ncbi:MAG: hypothetical protein RLN70_01365, partial [Rhodospirillaceae bacterium]